MLAGWLLVLAAIVLLRALPARTGFAVAGMAVEVLGFVLAARNHIPSRSTKFAERQE